MNPEDWLNSLSDKGFRYKFLMRLTHYFSSDELKTLCFILSIDYDEIGGESKIGKARELMIHLERREQLVGLIFAAQALRPNIDWPKWPKPQVSGVDFSPGTDDGTWDTIANDALSSREGNTWTFDSVAFTDSLG